MSSLFSQIGIGSMIVKNRFVRSATQDWLGEADGSISERALNLYEQLAKGGVGLIITAHAYVEHPRGKASARQNGIYADKFIDGYKRVVEIAHRYGAKLVLQAAHSGVQTNLELTEGIAPADVNELKDEEIWALVNAFSEAARRAQAAGCDGVQFHMAHGYLLARFISPQSNSRTDYWGGSLDKRLNLIKEIVKRSRLLVGKEFPLLVKLNSTGGFEGTAALAIEDVVKIAQVLENIGIDAIEVSGGVGSESKNSVSRAGIINTVQEAYFADNAKKIKQAVNIPVILVGGIRSRSVMERLLNEKIADMISLCRPFIKEPDIVNRLQQGQEKVSCISCNQCRNFTGIRCQLLK